MPNREMIAHEHTDGRSPDHREHKPHEPGKPLAPRIPKEEKPNEQIRYSTREPQGEPKRPLMRCVEYHGIYTHTYNTLTDPST